MVHSRERREFQHINGKTWDGFNSGDVSIVRIYTSLSFSLHMSSVSWHSGAWKRSTFKKYNFEAEGIPTNGGALHPLLKVREEIRNIFLEMGYLLVLISPRMKWLTHNYAFTASQRCPQAPLLNLVFGASMLFLCLNNIQHEKCKILSTCLASISLPCISFNDANF